jgi:hypothetical protein
MDFATHACVLHVASLILNPTACGGLGVMFASIGLMLIVH